MPLDPPAGMALLGVSANRGDGGESVTYRVPDGTSGGAVRIVASGYNGSADATSPYTLLVSVTPPDKAPTCVSQIVPVNGLGVPGTAPSSLSGRQTLILTNQKRLGDLYGATAAANVMTKLAAFAARPDVNGVVLPVETVGAIQQAYNAWDASPCSVAAANGVVRAINSYVDAATNNLQGLKYLVIAGSDIVLPMARVRDRVDLDNEASYANDQVYNSNDNPLSAALRAGYLLTDDAYGDANPIPWLDAQAFVPDVAIGRLLETPADITKAVDQYVASGGVRSPTTAYTAGYDFNADGAQRVADLLAAKVGATSARTTINATWTKADAIAGIIQAAHGFVSVNAHYDAFRALPADQNSGGTQTQLLTSGDLPADLGSSVLFTIGCHAGLSVADTFVASPSEAARKADWVQSVASRGGVYAANTGYGYGDTVAVAYSEKLMADLAGNLDGSMTVGQALMLAKHSNLHLPLGAVDVKVMQEALLYGLPMYRIGSGGGSLTSMVPVVPTAADGATANGVAEALDLTVASGRHLVQKDTGRGTYFVVQNGTGAAEAPLALPGRPLEPQTTDLVPRRGDDLRAHGVVVDSLSTRVIGGGGFDPVYSVAVPDSSALSPEPSTVGAFFPATLASVVERATRAGLQDAVVLTPGQFRAASPTTGRGFQQLADKLGYHLVYSASDDTQPPTISTVDGAVTGTQVRFTVTSPSDDADSATVLYLVAGGPSLQAWKKVALTSSDGGRTFTGTDTVPAGTTLVEQYFVQLLDKANNVSVSSKKGQDFSAETRPAGDGPSITLSSTPVAGHVVGPQVVTVDGATAVTLDGAARTYTGPFTVTGTGVLHTVTATNEAGTSSVSFTIDAAPAPVVTITSPSASTSYTEGQDIPAVFRCDGSGAVTCTASPAVPDNTLGTHTFTVTAGGVPGTPVSASVTYVVRRSPFVGLLQPVDDGPGATPSVFKKNSTIPLKFQIVGSNGLPIPDARGAAIVATCDATVTFTTVGSVAAPVDENSVTDTPDSGGCFRYDASADQFQYNFGTKNLAAGQWYVLRIHFATAGIPDHTIRIGLR